MLSKSTRKTKVVWSYSAAQLRPEFASHAVEVEADVVRLVFEKKNLPEISVFLNQLNEVSKSGSYRPPVMLDLSPTSRAYLTDVGNSREISFGETLVLSSETAVGSLKVTSDYWDELFKEGESAFLDYGNIQLKILSVEKSKSVYKVTSTVELGGTITSDMPVHVPSTRAISHSAQRLNQLAPDEMKQMASQGIDYLVVSGAVGHEYMRELKRVFHEVSGREPWLLLKIDSKLIVEKLPEFLDDIHGVYVSRRDLALTTDAALVPMITKEIIQLCNEHAKIIVTASEILGSMRKNPTPTRAEVSDIANAVIDGTDAVVLAEEIPLGPYTGRALDVVDKVIKDVEQSSAVHRNWGKADPKIKIEMDAVAYGAFHTARRVGAKAIVCLTELGNTALKLSSFRPPIDVIAVTFDESTRRKMALVRGVDGMLLNKNLNIEQVLDVINHGLLENSWLKEGDLIVFVSVTLSSVSRTDSNLFTVQRLVRA